jgi:hypothetical protein
MSVPMPISTTMRFIAIAVSLWVLRARRADLQASPQQC